MGAPRESRLLYENLLLSGGHLVGLEEIPVLFGVEDDRLGIFGDLFEGWVDGKFVVV